MQMMGQSELWVSQRESEEWSSMYKPLHLLPAGTAELGALVPDGPATTSGNGASTTRSTTKTRPSGTTASGRIGCGGSTVGAASKDARIWAWAAAARMQAHVAQGISVGTDQIMHRELGIPQGAEGP